MYLPQGFARTDVEALHAFIEEHAFGTLIVPGPPHDVSHVPFLLDRARGERGTLLAHVARANPIWRAFDGRTAAIAVFHGPHGYVSPGWYTTRNEVPTWNYVVVHAQGAPRVLDGGDELRGLLRRLAEVFERGRPDPWSVDELTPDTYAELSQAIVGFEIPVDRLEGKFKLSQNRKPEDREGAIRGLRERGTPDDLALVRLMTRPVVPER
jgi:transcriptional regulator